MMMFNEVSFLKVTSQNICSSKNNKKTPWEITFDEIENDSNGKISIHFINNISKI